MFKRILVPLDGSILSERAIPHASVFAKIFNAKIFLLQVLDPSQFQQSTQAMEPLNWQIHKAEADLCLRSVANNLRENQLDVEHVVLEGRTAETIIDFAQQEQIDLLVLSTHGAGGLSRWNTSSMVNKIVDKVYLPVLIIRAYQEAEITTSEEAEGVLPAFASYHRIMLPIDSSRRAECSLPVAINLAQGLETLQSGQSDTPPTLVLTSVLKPPDIPIPPPYSAEISSSIEQLMRISKEAVINYMNDLQGRISVNSEVNIIEHSSVPAAIHQLAEEKNIDLVIFCAHGQSGHIAWPFGSVSRNFVEYGEKNVLIIQDMHRSQVRVTAAEIAAEKYGKR